MNNETTKKEKSYMLAIPKSEESIKDVAGIMTRLSKSEALTLIDHKFEETLQLVVKVDGEEYRVEVMPMDYEIPQMFRTQHFFPDLDIEAISNGSVGLAVEMEFGEDALKSYHAQLKIICTLLADVLAVIDYSSEKILSGKWVSLAAASAVAPAPRYMYTVQAVAGEDECVWLHSHGLNRCGLPEIEVLDSTKDTYDTHYNVLEITANRMLELEDALEQGEPLYVARVTQNIPLMATLIDWKEAVSHYPEDMIGGAIDRKEDHNENTCGLFVYPSYEAMEKRQYAPLSVYDDLLEENPLYMISNKETARMRQLALERIPYMLEAGKNKDYTILIKIGLDVDEEHREAMGPFEHIWFELMEASENTVTCKLTQEPYYVKNMHEGSIGTYPFDKITDWIIYTKERRITPDDVYLMEH